MSRICRSVQKFLLRSFLYFSIWISIREYTIQRERQINYCPIVRLPAGLPYWLWLHLFYVSHVTRLGVLIFVSQQASVFPKRLVLFHLSSTFRAIIDILLGIFPFSFQEDFSYNHIFSSNNYFSGLLIKGRFDSL